MSKEKLRTSTKQPGVYLNQKTGKYDVKYNYTEYNDFKKYYGGKVFVRVTKSYNSVYRELKGTKNYKTRKIPLPQPVIELYQVLQQEHLKSGGMMEYRVFDFEHGSCVTVLRRACLKVGIRECNCHTFRHTYISNLIRKCVPISVIEQVSGDTQETILKRYSHMFEGDENMVLAALERIER